MVITAKPLEPKRSASAVAGASPLAALILAAGQGKRMHAELPKVLHLCLDLPLLVHVVRLAVDSGARTLVIVVSPTNQDAIKATLQQYFGQFTDLEFIYAVQEVARGTGDAVATGLKALPHFAGQILILYGDVPLLQTSTLQSLAAAANQPDVALAFLTAKVAEPTGYGRVVRTTSGKVLRIVEQVDATPEEQSLKEINAGVYLLSAAVLRQGLSHLSQEQTQITANKQGEFYLVDIVKILVAEGKVVLGIPVADPQEVLGVNSKKELHQVSKILQERIITAHEQAGVTFRDRERVFIGSEVRLGPEVQIGIDVQLWGKTVVEGHVEIHGPTVIKDAWLHERSQIQSFSLLEQAEVGPGAVIGPYARLRPGSQIGEGAHVGNFVELKNTILGAGSKANHLAYLGDAEIGSKSNIGAGTITCNYDGQTKHRTVIAAEAFIGSNATLVAPLQIGKGAYIAAGSTITKAVEPEALAFGRARQVNRLHDASRLKQAASKVVNKGE